MVSPRDLLVSMWFHRAVRSATILTVVSRRAGWDRLSASLRRSFPALGIHLEFTGRRGEAFEGLSASRPVRLTLVHCYFY